MALLPMDPRLWGERFPGSIRDEKTDLGGQEMHWGMKEKN
jgi:hypothetical protein